MTRHPSDENILLLAHGELSAWRGLALQIHLRRCPQCRARYDGFAQTSAAIAAALREPKSALWQPASSAPKSRFVFAALGALIALLGALIGAFYLAALSNQRHSTPVKSARPSDGCAPNLPGDRCR